MNLNSIYPLQKDNKKLEVELSSAFVGVVSLQSTTISDFHYGILGGYNSIVNLDKSSVINMRGVGIKLIHPRIFKMQSCIIQKVEEDGIDIIMIQPKMEKSSVDS